MGKTRRNPELLTVTRAEMHTHPTPKRLRIQTDIDRYIVDCTA